MIQINRPFLTILACTIVIPVIFLDTLFQMIQTWNGDDTYTHGFFILPIAIWLIWQKRNALTILPINPEPKTLILLAPLSLGWIIANTVDVQIVQQFIMISMIIVSVWTLLGRSVVIKVAFPLLFLFLAIPFGKSLIPSLMEFTANFTVVLIDNLGIPIYREGLYFTLPTGNWSVIEACSGLNYFIASITLGLLYSYLTYHSIYKRVVFILITIAISILANGFRAFGIVMIGHFSNMEYGTGGDHTFYGWVFYGIIIFALFYLGSFWADPVLDDYSNAALEKSTNTVNTTATISYQFSLAIVCLLMMLSSVQYAKHLETSKHSIPTQHKLDLPQNFAGWQKSEDIDLDWKPVFINPDLFYIQTYHYGEDRVKLSMGYFYAQRKNAEAISSSNKISNYNFDNWKKINSVELNIETHYIKETELQNGDNKILVWNWYRMGAQDTPSPYIAKAIEAYNLIALNRTEAAIIAIATPLNNDKEYARQQLQQFWLEANDEIYQLLDQLSTKPKNHQTESDL